MDYPRAVTPNQISYQSFHNHKGKEMKHLLVFLLAVLATPGIADRVVADDYPQDDLQQISNRLARNIPLRADRPFGNWRKNVPHRAVAPRFSDDSLRRMPGEFEEQEFLFLSCGELTAAHAETIADIAAAIQRHVRVVVLFTSDDQRTTLIKTLSRRVDSTRNVSFLRVAHDTKWIRDFGPTVLRNGAQALILDWQYDQNRPNDDAFPLNLSAMSRIQCEPSQLQLEGGNLLSNGNGLCVTTTAVTQRNAGHDLNEAAVCTLLRSSVGAQQVIVLEPLAGEETGHVDMFVTFTGPNTVVVGAYSPKEDPENAALLDRNAARLASLKTPSGQLRVERIPMGRRHNGLWRTYTNCIYANGVLLVPVYQDGDDNRSRQALALYRRLLPQWHIVPIDATQLIEEGGALHCVALNVPCLADQFDARRLRIDNSTTPLIEVHHYSATRKKSALTPMRQRDGTAMRPGTPEAGARSLLRLLRTIW